MSTPELQAVRHLEEEFAEAMTRLYAVGNGLARLRSGLEAAPLTGLARLGPMPPPPPPRPIGPIPVSPVAVLPAAVRPPAVVRPHAAAPPAEAPPAEAPPLAAPPAAVRPPEVAWWQREGAVTRILGATGAVVTLAGLVMLLVLAAKHGLLGPVPRVIGGALLATGLVGVAHRVRRAEASNVGALAIAATGYAAGYLDIVAVTTFYHWIPAWLGLVLAGGVAVTGLLIARAWHSEWLASGIVLGVAVLAPALTEGLTWVTGAFLLTMTVASFPAQLGNRWHALHLTRTTPTVLALLGAQRLASNHVAAAAGWRPQLLVMASVLALVTLGGAVLLTRRDRDDIVSSAVILGGALPLASVAYLFESGWRTGILAASAAAYTLIAVALTSRRGGSMPAHTIGSLTTLAAAETLLAIDSGAPRTLFGTALLVLALGYLAVAHLRRSAVVSVIAAILAAIAAVPYLDSIAGLGSEQAASRAFGAVTLLDSALVLAVTAALVAATTVNGAFRGPLLPLVRGAAGLATLVASAAGSVSAGVIVGRSVEDPTAGFIAGHAAATLLWLGAAAWLLLRGRRRIQDATLVLRLGLALTAVSVVKLFVFDLAALSGGWRVLAFIGAGILLLTMGTRYAKALERARHQGSPAAA